MSLRNKVDERVSFSSVSVFVLGLFTNCYTLPWMFTIEDKLHIYLFDAS